MSERNTVVRRTVFGNGALSKIRGELNSAGFRHPFIVATKGRSSNVEAIRREFAGCVAGVYDDAVEHVPVEVTETAAAVLRNSGADIIIAVGGGSAIGLGKALVLRTGLPLAAVPTTYSGSEMTSIYGEKDQKGKKTGRDRRVAPSIVFYDPELTLDFPPEKSAASGLNAFAHCVEALYAPNRSELSEFAALEGVRLLSASLPEITADPHSSGARSRAFQGARLAGEALELASMGLHHRICHVLGGLFRLPHAETHSVILRYVVAYNFRAARPAMKQIEAAMNVPDAIQGISGLCDRLPVPRNLGQLGLKESDIQAAATEIMSAAYPNPRTPTFTEMVQILALAFTGSSPLPLIHGVSE